MQPSGALVRDGLLVCLVTFTITPLARASSYDCVALSVPGPPTGINNAGVIVGSALPRSSPQGYIRDTSGNVTLINYPGATSTQLFAINNRGVATGRFAGPGTGTFGFFTVDLQGNIKTIQFPPPYDLTTDSIFGINDDGAIVAVTNPNTGLSAFVLKPDGTVEVSPITFPPGQNDLVGSLNNSYQFLLPSSIPGFGQTLLVGPDGSATPIQWNRPGEFSQVTAFGLNNAGVVVGYSSFDRRVGSNPPWAGFVRDGSGTFTPLDCPALMTNSVNPNAINDSGVIVGTVGIGGPSFIATPVPGTPQFQSSVSSIVFPPMTAGRQSAPVNVIITNTGDGRLDLGGPIFVGGDPAGPPLFQASSCIEQGATVVSLNPGESCMVSVTAVPPGAVAAVGRPLELQDTLSFSDTASGAPHSIPVSVLVFPFPLPFCLVNSVVAGPPRQANFIVQGPPAASIVPLDAINAAVNIPPPPFGFGQISVSATQVDPTQLSKVDIQVTRTDGSMTACGSVFGSSQFTGLGGTFTSHIAIAQNADGRLEAFVRAVDNALWHTWQTSPGDSWSAWESLGGVLNSDPAVGRNADGRLEVFAIGSGNSLWHIWQTSRGGNWSAWDALGGTLNGNPAVTLNAHGRLEVVAQGSDSALWHIAQTTIGGTWSNWESLGGILGSDPVLAVNADQRLEVFALGTDSSLWHIAQTTPGGAWADWAGLGGTLEGDPAVAVNADGRLEVFGRGARSGLWHIWQITPGTDWSDWNSLGGSITTPPAAASNADGRLEAFARGADGALWHISQTSAGGGWSDWSTLAGQLADQPAVARNTDGRLEILVRGTDNALDDIVQSSSVGTWN